MSRNSIGKNLFLELYKLCLLGLETGNWVSNVKSIFKNHDMLHYFNMENVSKVEIDDEIKCMQDVNQKPILFLKWRLMIAWIY